MNYKSYQLKGELIKQFGSIDAARNAITRDDGSIYTKAQFSSAINGNLTTQTGADIRAKCLNAIITKENEGNVGITR